MLSRPAWLLLTLTVLSAQAAAAADAGVPTPLDWDLPGVVARVDVGTAMQVNGRPQQVVALKVKGDPVEVLKTLMARFRAQGFYVPARPVRIEGLKLPYVTALDDVRMVSYLAWAWPEKDGTATVMLGAADVSQAAPQPSGGLPVFPGATRVTRFNLEVTQATAFTAAATRDEVLDYYRTVLPSGGFAEREPGVFVSGHRRLRLMARDEGAQKVGVVLLEEADAQPLLPAP